jgi:murein DD-endopeptidase MepM/ murein hydrolase activator NlpD
MSIGPAIYMGQVGITGRVTGPHTHKELIELKTGKRLPLSQARADVGQNIQFRLPGSKEWQYLYSQTAPGEFALNPAAPMTSPKGMRKHPVTGQMAMHMGEDYGLPRGTDLRYLGTGSVESIANYGNAGNIARLRTGDNRYQLDIFHLDKLPEQAKVGSSEVPTAAQLPGEEVNEERNNKLMEALFGKKESLKDVLMAGALQQAMQQRQTSPLDQLPSLQSQVFTPEQAMALFS